MYIFSQLAKWAVTRDNKAIEYPVLNLIYIPEVLRKLSLKSKIAEIMTELRKADVLMIEAPTGSGKSALVSKYYYWMLFLFKW